MRLSKKGWNNVLILGILIMIFLFNFSHKLLLKPKIQQRTLINSERIIVEIKTPDFSIKRSGRSWKSEPDLGLSEQQLSLLIQNWQHLKLKTHPPAKSRISPYTIQVYIAKQEQPIVVQLFQYGDDYLLQTEKDLSMLLNAHQLPLLLGR
ncbi:MAG: hypothetical protein V5786_12165 [Psychromonas sp.]